MYAQHSTGEVRLTGALTPGAQSPSPTDVQAWAIDNGTVMVNGRIVARDYVLINGECVVTLERSSTISRSRLTSRHTLQPNSEPVAPTRASNNRRQDQNLSPRHG